MAKRKTPKKAPSQGRPKQASEKPASGNPRSDGKARVSKPNSKTREAKRASNRPAGANRNSTAGTARGAGRKAEGGGNNRPARTRTNTTAAQDNVRKGRLAEPPATSQDPIRFPDETRPLRKTRLGDKDLAQFRDLLLRKRAELCGDVARLTDEALSGQGRGRGESSAMPIHMADLGSDNWEQEFNLGLLANEQALVREIDEALERIENRTYGVCLGTGKPITKARLRATPWTKYCIDYARAREEGRAV